MKDKQFLDWAYKNQSRSSFYISLDWIKDFNGTQFYKDMSIVKDATNMYFAPQFPPCDVYINEKTQDIKFLFALAGYKNDVDITFEDDYLILSMEKEDLEKNDEWLSLKKGISTKKFISRYFIPSAKYNFDKVEAEYSEGMLEVFIPLKEEAKPKRIKVRRS